jgi:uncharacterized protein
MRKTMATPAHADPKAQTDYAVEVGQSGHPVKSTVPAQSLEGAPWWRFGLVWMVWGGPALVVVASFITLALALMIPDPVVSQEPGGAARTAAHQARNHAATGSVVQPKPGTR